MDIASLGNPGSSSNSGQFVGAGGVSVKAIPSSDYEE